MDAADGKMEAVTEVGYQSNEKKENTRKTYLPLFPNHMSGTFDWPMVGLGKQACQVGRVSPSGITAWSEMSNDSSIPTDI